MTDTDINIQLERHDQHIKSLQHQVDDLKQVQHEIKTMGETLVVLTTEIRHTNHSVNDLKQKVDVIESQPRAAEPDRNRDHRGAGGWGHLHRYHAAVYTSVTKI